MEPEEEPDGAAVREVYEEAGVKGKLGRLLGIFEVSYKSNPHLADRINDFFLPNRPDNRQQPELDIPLKLPVGKEVIRI